jgi:hypothetical protein
MRERRSKMIRLKRVHPKGGASPMWCVTEVTELRDKQLFKQNWFGLQSEAFAFMKELEDGKNNS